MFNLSIFHTAIQEILIEPGAGDTAVKIIDVILSWDLLSTNEAAHK